MWTVKKRAALWSFRTVSQCELTVLCVSTSKLRYLRCIYTDDLPPLLRNSWCNSLKKLRPGPGVVRLRLCWTRKRQRWGTFSQVTQVLGGGASHQLKLRGYAGYTYTKKHLYDNLVRPTKKYLLRPLWMAKTGSMVNLLLVKTWKWELPGTTGSSTQPLESMVALATKMTKHNLIGGQSRL